MKTETNLTTRWEKGTDHHPKSLALFKRLEAADFKLAGDSFCFKSGGDGDNGETLMFLMDVVFEAQDNGEDEELCKLIELPDRYRTPMDGQAKKRGSIKK